VFGFLRTLLIQVMGFPERPDSVHPTHAYNLDLIRIAAFCGEHGYHRIELDVQRALVTPLQATVILLGVQHPLEDGVQCALDLVGSIILSGDQRLERNFQMLPARIYVNVCIMHFQTAHFMITAHCFSATIVDPPLTLH
jgi:hypothetical protein